MEKIKNALKVIFIDGLSGMATGLFATLIIGTIISQIGSFIPGVVGTSIVMMGKVASSVTGAGIGMGVAIKYKETPLVIISAAVAGMMGAFASKILAGTVLVEGVINYAGPGEPLGAFIAAIVAVGIGHLISGKTKVDILITPFVSIVCGSSVGLILGPPISAFMAFLGQLVNVNVEAHPFIGGIVVSVLMGIILTLPISSAALGIILNLSGLAAGAATVGCCANMVGFAVASFKDNGVNGLLAQGLGTSMLQIGNIVKKPVIWLPAIITSAILGPVSTLVFKMTNNATGSGMGSAGLVGQITTYQTMAPEAGAAATLIKIILIQFVFTGALAYIISLLMRKAGMIKDGDMKLDV
ncbi:MAG: PTS sugar transporter subunit IIC [Lachnospiraceae bacterium]|nr:PTS sugar transporter subunit IIC [Lachnospiraceae bacterium]